MCRLRGKGEVIKREEFEKRKAAAESERNARLNKRPKKLSSQGKDLSGHPLLQVSPRLSVVQPVWPCFETAPLQGCTTFTIPFSKRHQQQKEAVQASKRVTIVFSRMRNSKKRLVRGHACTFRAATETVLSRI